MFGKKDNQPQSDIEFFTIFDTKTQSYREPVHAINKHDLVRQSLNIMKDPAQRSSQYYTNAEDFQIFKIGSFCKKTGTLMCTNLEHIANFHDLKALALSDQNAPERNVTPGLGIVST